MQNSIINWNNVFANSDEFKNNKPFRFGFVEEFLNRDFYEKLYQTYPKVDDSWNKGEGAGYRKSSKSKMIINPNGEDLSSTLNLDENWLKFIEYFKSNEFLEGISKYSGINITKTENCNFIVQAKGDFQLPHVDVDGDYTNSLQMLVYFSKDWQKGDPGGTYICTEEDESSIIFEPYNLDNSFVLFEETPHSWHGTRYITKEVIRQGFSIAFR